MSEKRFSPSLKEVATRLGVPYSAVKNWRDVDDCPFLDDAPYDVEAIQLWLTQQAKLEIDPASEKQLEKITLEIDKLKRDGLLFTKDKMFWLALIALGVPVAREIREWLANDRRVKVDAPKAARARVVIYSRSELWRSVELFNGYLISMSAADDQNCLLSVSDVLIIDQGYLPWNQADFDKMIGILQGISQRPLIEVFVLSPTMDVWMPLTLYGRFGLRAISVDGQLLRGSLMRALHSLDPASGKYSSLVASSVVKALNVDESGGKNGMSP